MVEINLSNVVVPTVTNNLDMLQRRGCVLVTEKHCEVLRSVMEVVTGDEPGDLTYVT